jgi:dienelactone hydrolase
MRTGFLLAGLACLCACAHPQPCAPDPAGPGSAGPVSDVREVTLAGGFLTVWLDIPRVPAGPKPAVISPAVERDALRDAGAVIVTFRANWDLLKGFVPPAPAEPAPANTVGAWLLAAPTAKTVGKGYFDLIAYNANTAVPAIVDHLVTVPEIDPRRIGIGGRSTGGITALQALAAEPRLAAGAVTVACGDYPCFLHLSTLGMKGEPLDLDPAYEARLNQLDPVRHSERLTHAALLMVNGADDLAVPLPCAQATRHAFAKAYARAGVPERFRYVVVEGEGHNLSARADDEVMAWWYRWLLRPGEPTSARPSRGVRRRFRPPSPPTSPTRR